MKRILLGSGIGAVVLFIWGFVFWGATGLGNAGIRSVDDQAAVQAALSANFPQSGTYVVPFAADPSEAKFQALHKAGPIAVVHFRATGSEPMAPGTFVMGLAHEFLVLLVMGMALSRFSGGFGSRLMVVFLAGMSGTLFAEMAGPIWWYQPWGMAVSNIIYQAVGWLLGGAALAWFVKAPNSV